MLFAVNARGSRTSLISALYVSILPLLLLLLTVSLAQASPVTMVDATTAAQNWLALESHPLGADLSHVLRDVRTYTSDDGAPLYYAISLSPSGYVIVSSDDLVEPIIAFSPDGDYEAVPDNPMYALIANDLRARLERSKTRKAYTSQNEEITAAGKWHKLLVGNSGPAPQGLSSVSDPRVDPFVLSKWNQSGDRGCGYTTYNYYTPSNYVSGCVATAAAQLMRFWQYPTAGVGTPSFTTTICGGSSALRSLRGGDGAGGPYNWASMDLDPNCPSTATRQAIGALCYDAGCAVNMNWCSSSGADTLQIADALKSTFGYSNAKKGYNGGSDLPAEPRNRMINANLHAGYPVILGITDGANGHAVVADGYGYNLSSMYHHLNLGWSGSYSAWYNLPTIDAGSYTFNSSYKCIYNVYPSGTGEIIAGRVTDTSGNPIPGVIVTATPGGFTDTTDSRGIYALPKVGSNKTYTVSVTGCIANSQSVTTGASSDYSTNCGNKWPIDFSGPPDVNWQCSTDIPQNIEDNSTIWSTLPISGTDRVADVDVRVNIAHTYDGDLQVYLEHPDGTLVELFTTVGFSGDNFTNTVLDDEAATSITSGAAPFTGSYRPEGLLSALDGKPAAGTWRLKVTDGDLGDTGVLQSWCLRITTAPPIPSVTNVTSDAANGAYGLGSIVDIKATFSEAVAVTGTPQLELETGTVDRTANYLSGSGTNTLTFRYTAQSGDTSSDLCYKAVGSLTLNGGTIKNMAGANATLTLPTPGATGSLSYNKSIIIDTTPPSTPSVTDGGAFQVDYTHLSATWTAATDISTGVCEYQYAIGTSPSNLIVPWKSAGLSLTATESGLALQRGSIYYWYVKAKDCAGNWSPTSSSDGIAIVSTKAISIDAAKSLIDGDSVALESKVVSATDAGIYIQDDPPWAGIRVAPAGLILTPAVGSLVDVGGVLSTNASGERLITGIIQLRPGSGVPHIVGLANGLMGGANRNYVSATGQGQQGVDGGVGLNNVGMLVRVWGRLSGTGLGLLQTYSISDGSRTGLNIEFPEGMPTPSSGSYISATGICSCARDIIEGKVQPLLKVQSWEPQ